MEVREPLQLDTLFINIAKMIHTARTDGFLAVQLFEEQDFIYHLLNLNIKLIQHGVDAGFHDFMIELEIQKFRQTNTITDSLLEKIILIQKIIPVINYQDAVYIQSIALHYCSHDTILQLHSILHDDLTEESPFLTNTIFVPIQ